MVRRVVPAIVVVISLGVIAGGAYLGWQMLIDAGGPADEDIARASAQVEEAVDPAVIDDVRVTIAETHEELNGAFGFGGLDDPDLEELDREVARPVATRVADLAGEIDDPDLERDLSTVVRLLEVGIERGDPRALAYAHRVLHDLDYFAFNPNGDGSYWEATVTLEGGENDTQRYLAELDGAVDTDDG